MTNGQVGLLSGALLISAGCHAGFSSDAGGLAILIGGVVWIVVGLMKYFKPGVA